MAYRQDNRKDRWKAVAAVLLVHVGLGAVILTGLNVDTVRRAVERMQTFNLDAPKPPPDPPPPPPKQQQQDSAGAPAAPKASPVAAPEPEIELPANQEIVAAPVPGTGSSSSSGQGGVGSGSGAGGTGTGVGSGSGSGGGNTPARLVRNISRGDYRALTGGRMSAGRAGVAIRVNASGRVDSCRVEHSSGDAAIDSGLCPLLASRLRFEPARNAQGQPIAFFTHYMATWGR